MDSIWKDLFYKERIMKLGEFGAGLRDYFSVRSPKDYADPLTFILRNWVLDIIKFDDLMVERHGDFILRGMSTYDIVEAEYGKRARAWLERSIR